jgi:processing peptidase subunit alpha
LVLAVIINATLFQTTQNFSTKEQVFGILDANSALIDCQSTRDTFIYAASCRTTGMDDVMRIIADAVLRPVITAEEVVFKQKLLFYG